MNIKKLLMEKGTDVETVRPETQVQAALQAMMARNIGLLVVCDGEQRIAGVFSERDLARAVAIHGGDVATQSVKDIMTRDVAVCRMGDKMEDVMDQMTRGRFRHMPVVEAGKLAGIVSSTDILRYLSEHATSADRAMILSKIAWA